MESNIHPTKLSQRGALGTADREMITMELRIFPPSLSSTYEAPYSACHPTKHVNIGKGI
jgi:hypothetical protein